MRAKILALDDRGSGPSRSWIRDRLPDQAAVAGFKTFGISDVPNRGMQSIRGTDSPTIQQTLSEGAEPVSKSASTPLVCRDQEAPRSFEISTKPARPARHRTFEPGATIKRGLETVTTSIMEVAAVRPAAGPAAGSGGAAAARAAFISFFLLSVWPSGAGPGTFCELALV